MDETPCAFKIEKQTRTVEKAQEPASSVASRSAARDAGVERADRRVWFYVDAFVRSGRSVGRSSSTGGVPCASVPSVGGLECVEDGRTDGRTDDDDGREESRRHPSTDSIPLINQSSQSINRRVDGRTEGRARGLTTRTEPNRTRSSFLASRLRGRTEIVVVVVDVGRPIEEKRQRTRTRVQGGTGGFDGS